MKRIVVDTNIAFSTFLNVNSRIAQILLNGAKYYVFYSPEYIKYELLEHKERIKHIGKLNENRFVELYGLILHNIQIMNHSVIPMAFYQSAEDICKNIDIDDTPFVAINDYVKGRIWTGDTKLIDGLSAKGYKRIVTTTELYADFVKSKKRD